MCNCANVTIDKISYWSAGTWTALPTSVGSETDIPYTVTKFKAEFTIKCPTGGCQTCNVCYGITVTDADDNNNYWRSKLTYNSLCGGQTTTPTVQIDIPAYTGGYTRSYHNGVVDAYYCLSQSCDLCTEVFHDGTKEAAINWVP